LAMPNFRVDRTALPKPWADPLIFPLSDGRATLQAEIEQKAAIEYQSAWRAGGVALALAPQRTEYFVQSVEAGANRILSDAEQAGCSHLILGWSDLNP
jgi:hypothetical protein